MFYEFAANLTLEEVRDVINRHNESLGVKAFIEADRGEYVIFNYLLSFDLSFPVFTGDPVRDREIAIIYECRGLTFYKDTGEVAIRKLTKFWNVNQRPESQAHAIDWTRPHSILMKLDGSMISPYRRRDGGLEFHTKMGSTDVAQPVNAFVSTRPEYIRLIEWMEEHDFTPLFEWCSRQQKIVIDYPEDMLVLLAARHKTSGAVMPYAEMASLVENCDIYGHAVPVVKRIEGSVTDINVMLEIVRVLKGEEGYVIRFDNGHMVKIKAEEYCSLHGMADLLQFEKNVLALILGDTLDDAKALMDDDSRARVSAFEDAVQRGIIATADRLRDYADRAVAAVGQDKKRLALEWVNVDAVASRDRPLIFRIVGGDDAVDTVRAFVAKNVGTATKVEEIRPYIGGANWDQYRNLAIVLDD